MKESVQKYIDNNNLIEELRKKQLELVGVIAKEHGIKIGDIVECNSYSYKGEKMKVFSFRFFLDSWRAKGNPCFIAKGHVLKKDGTEGKRIGESVIELKE